ncbi:MAG: MoaD/ThiS family protein [Candidatus Woesearchaeota archaeon]
MKIYIEKDNKTIEIKFSGKLLDLLKKLKINPETVIVVCGNTLITLDHKLDNSDEIRILSVVSGG